MAQFSWREWGIPRNPQRGYQVSWPNGNCDLLKTKQECQPSAAIFGEWRSKERHDNPLKKNVAIIRTSWWLEQQCGMAVGAIHDCGRNACFPPSLKWLPECCQLHGPGSSFRSQWYSPWQISSGYKVCNSIIRSYEWRLIFIRGCWRMRP